MAVKKKFKIEEPEKVEAEAETIEEIVEPEVEEPKKASKEEVKEYTEEELVVMPREELYKVIEDIKAGKAKCKPRIL